MSKSKNSLTPLVQLHHLTAWYEGTTLENRVSLFSQASLTLMPGKFYGLWAENGMGKTSLCHFLLGLKPAQELSLTVGGFSFTGQVNAGWRALLAEDVFYVPSHQEQDTVAAFKRFLLKKLRKEEAKNPDRFSEVLDHLGVSLEENLHIKLLMIVLALASPRKWILLDEPFYELEECLQERVITLLKEWVKTEQTCVLLISHQRSVLMQCEDLFTIEDQKIVPVKLSHISKFKAQSFGRKKHALKSSTQNAQDVLRVEDFSYKSALSSGSETVSFFVGVGQRLVFSCEDAHEWFDPFIQLMQDSYQKKRVLKSACEGRVFFKGQSIFSQKRSPTEVLFLDKATHTFSPDVTFRVFFNTLFHSIEVDQAEEKLDEFFTFVEVPETVL